MIKFNWPFKVISSKGMRLSTFLLQKGISRTLLKQIKFNGGQIKVDNIEQKTNYILRNGGNVEVTLPPEEASVFLKPSFAPINIVYENTNFLIVNKPAGLPSIPTKKKRQDSLANRILGYYLKHNLPSKKVHLVTRLDEDTSGLVILAKNHLAHSVLDQQLKRHQLKKDYLALVVGNFKIKHSNIVLPIARDSNSFVKRKVSLTGRAAWSEVWQVAGNNYYTLLKIRLHTGRTHQIRVHLSSLGYPLVGDWLYNLNLKKDLIKRQALHCFHIKFYDPLDDQQIECQISLPVDFKQALSMH